MSRTVRKQSRSRCNGAAVAAEAPRPRGKIPWPRLQANRRAALLVGFCALGACVANRSSQVEAPAVDHPTNWTTAVARPDSTAVGWLDELADPELVALVTEAWQHNADLQVAAARFLVSDLNAQAAGANRWPTLDARFDARRAKSVIQLPQVGLQPVRSTTYSVQAVLQWEIDLWGRLAAGRRAAVADRAAAADDYAGARLALAVRTTRAWYAWQAQRASQAVLRRLGRRLHEQRALLTARYDEGLGSAAELQDADAQLAAWQARHASQAAVLDRAGRQLQVLVGRYPAGGLQAVTAWPPRLPPLRAGVPSTLLQRRPDIRAARWRLVGADERRLAALADRFPRLSLTASGGTSSDDLGDLVDPDFSIWSLAGNLLAPLFDGGRRAAAQAVARAQVDTAAVQYVAAVRQAFFEVETALAVEAELRQQRAALARLLEQRGQQEARRQRHYASGVVDVVALRPAANAVDEAHLQLIEVDRALIDNRMACYLALGGDAGLSDETVNEENP